MLKLKLLKSGFELLLVVYFFNAKVRKGKRKVTQRREWYYRFILQTNGYNERE